jgi:hypothetical protein
MSVCAAYDRAEPEKFLKRVEGRRRKPKADLCRLRKVPR